MKNETMPASDENVERTLGSETEAIRESVEIPEAVSQTLGEAAINLANLAEQQKKADSFIRAHGPLLSLFSKDSSLRFASSATDSTFSFDASNFTVNVPLSWFAEGKYSDSELLFANYHERAHFLDMRKNPEAYIGCFDYMKEKSGKLAKSYRAKHPEEPASTESIQHFYYSELHSLYNMLDDIYVNDLVKGRVPLYGDRENEGAEAIDSLYAKLGFGEADLREQPLHRQFAGSLLRDAMVGERHGQSIVDERVSAALDKKRAGKSLRTLTYGMIRCFSGAQIDPAERYDFIKKHVEPVYLDLLELAMDEAQDKKQSQNQDNQQDGQSGQGEGQGRGQGQEQDQSQDQGQGQSRGGEFNPFGDDKNSQSGPSKDPLDKGENGDEVLRQILDSFAEQDKLDEASPEERKKMEAEKRRRAFDKAHGITEEERKDSDMIRDQMSGARKEMRKFWSRLIGKSVEYRLRQEGDQRRGRLDVNSFIKRYPDVVDATMTGRLDELDIYRRPVLEREIIDKPERIEVSMLVDRSGSMGPDRILAAKQTASLLMYSLKDFNDELNKTRHITHTKLHADSQVIAFGDHVRLLKPFAKERRIDPNDPVVGELPHGQVVVRDGSNDANIVRSISKIKNKNEWTNMAAPLAWIHDGIDGATRDRLDEKKLKKIVFVITDGVPDDAEETRQQIRELAATGTTVVGFQIGTVDEKYQRTFDYVFSNDGVNNPQNIKGIRLGTEIEKLPERLMDELSDSLGDIVI